MVGIRLLAAFALTLTAAAADVRSKSPVAADLTRPGSSTHFWNLPGTHTALGGAGARRVRAASWSGGTYTAFTGEQVTVFVSSTYRPDDALGRRWANTLATLLHGSELSLLTAYIAPHAEVEELCGARAVLGCYGGDELIAIGEAVDRVSAEEVLAHEYGHHVAAHRENTPWRALHWGTKRWASVADVCARTSRGTAFPGDQGVHYTLNPGEAFAETYRILNEVRGGPLDYTWSLLDLSFRPGAASLAAAEADVTQPWAQPVTRVVRARFRPKARSWTTTIPTPLDGDLSISLQAPIGSTHTLDVRTADRRVLARGLWSRAGEQRLTYRICGQRSVVVRVTRFVGAARFTMRVDAPS